MKRETMEYDVVIVGGGPAGLSAACRIKQSASAAGQDISVCLVEKGSEIGAHILSGAVIEDRALKELFPDWKARGAPLNVAVTHDDIYFLTTQKRSIKAPHWAIPRTMHNQGNYIVSLGSLCRWLAKQAEDLGVEIYPGFTAAEYILEDGVIKGIITGDMGVNHNGQPKDEHVPGMELRAKYTVFAEGCRGHLGKRLIAEFKLDAGKDPQHYSLGIKELWDLDPARHHKGLVLHGTGWPLMGSSTAGGFFLYHTENNQAVVGLFTDLSYSNPHLSPFNEFQRLKHHPVLKQYLQGGKRVSYGARAAAKGGINCLPKMTFPGGLLIGCDAGTLNFAKIKGVHTGMKSGMVAAEEIVAALSRGREHDEITEFTTAFEASWACKELQRSRNFAPAMHKFGVFGGAAFNFIDQNILPVPFTLHDTTPDHTALKPAAKSPQIDYPKPDGKLSFSRLDSVFISNVNHAEDQPCHLKLQDASIPLSVNLPEWDEPAQRYCPAGVYEITEDENGKHFQINAQNCVHCKTCDIKDPSQNITWVTPEGAGGPNYPNM
ncbi:MULTISPECIES: electron transfer flavoprotein-ubiquinone oxidoreductase [unclassified Thalassolituus]|uniref:electron transfer flavoprotein-ubiquinone oxidoreductase n=1 Tax=Oceanospirillaceae TaxID=135620 RepID=UPI00118FF994|nr:MULTISPECIES: electron transfer flavoprotein-ubiquinone oxidoreductase [unclassified Thalassolituus]MCA6061000.1 electron transfer flavoprotein-ubiquinone oxidoreductase [Thalassolituus sp. ST750PaO-4]TVV43814.1 electron transfer flavoprotein-ubiquinone oxidoreductase [Thalassolituus sp. C2-1]